MYHRKKVDGIELDFIFQWAYKKIICCEVKSNTSEWSLTERVSQQQKHRLYRAQTYLQQHTQLRVETKIALIGKNIDVYNLEECLF